MGAGHSHALPSSQNERKLWIALALTFMFLVAEAIGGVSVGCGVVTLSTPDPIDSPSAV